MEEEEEDGIEVEGEFDDIDGVDVYKTSQKRRYN
jgi:hypothetical protein